MDTVKGKIYIEQTLCHKILETNDDLRGQELIKCNATPAGTLNGFMSAIYTAELVTKCNETQKTNVRHIFIKFMKGDEIFRETTKADTQFANEIYISTKVIPYYKEFLLVSSAELKCNNWIPRVYYGYYGSIPELSNINESVLAAENVSLKGYRNGPRKSLDEPHLFLMTKLIAQYHAVSYAMKIKNPKHFKNIVNGIIPFLFLPAEGESNLYTVLYGIGFHRFFMYKDKISSKCSETFIKDTNNLRNKYGDNPALLLENFRREDETFSVILHGDYNRNNVLFRYDSEEGYDNPLDVKMIDFQEIRYGSPAIDLSFYMYMNMDPKLRNILWDKLLKFYHENIINCLADILKCTIDDDMLKPYSFDKFIQHFSQFAFYGVMVCIHFIPWMVCSEDECNKLSKLFETDMHGKEFRDFSIVVGGDAANDILVETVQHASDKGYMKIFE